MARAGVFRLDEEIAMQRGAIRERAPSYERALALLPSVLDGPAGRFVDAAWEDRRFVAWYERPLLLLASLRFDALAGGPDHPLHRGFAADEPDPAAVTEERLAAALDGSRDRVFECLARRSVQTNETSRAIAWLWPAALAGASGGGRPIALADVGASAGLNLVADALPPIWTAHDGSPVDVATDVRAVARLGLDPAPLDPLDREDALWLRACVWPGERHREERLDRALAAFRAARVHPDAPVLLPIAASNVPARLDLLSAAEADALVLAYQTVMRDFLRPAEREEYEAGMRDWLGTHPAGRALWVELEPGGDGGPLAATIVAHVRGPGGALRSLELARCGVHPSRLEVRPGRAAELAALLRAEAHAGARA
jgi:hypothetical protein